MPWSNWEPYDLLENSAAIWINVDAEKQNEPQIVSFDPLLTKMKLPVIVVADAKQAQVYYAMAFAKKVSPYMSNHKWGFTKRYDHNPVPIQPRLWACIKYVLASTANARFIGRGARSYKENGSQGRFGFVYRFGEGGVSVQENHCKFWRGMHVRVAPEDKALLTYLRSEEPYCSFWKRCLIHLAKDVRRNLRADTAAKRSDSFDQLENILRSSGPNGPGISILRPHLLDFEFKYFGRSKSTFEEFLQNRFPDYWDQLVAYRKGIKKRWVADGGKLGLAERNPKQNGCRSFEIFPQENGGAIAPAWLDTSHVRLFYERLEEAA